MMIEHFQATSGVVIKIIRIYAGALIKVKNGPDEIIIGSYSAGKIEFLSAAYRAMFYNIIRGRETEFDYKLKQVISFHLNQNQHD